MDEQVNRDLQLSEGEPTPLTLLNKALIVTLREYGEYYPLEMSELLEGLIYIRFKLEPMFIKDIKQLNNIYNRFRDGGFKSLGNTKISDNSDITIRFLSLLFSRWMTYLADTLGLNTINFIEYNANHLADVFTSFKKMPDLFSDTLGQTLTHEQWKEFLVDVPLFIVIFNLKNIDSDYVDQVREYCVLIDKNKNRTEYVPEG